MYRNKKILIIMPFYFEYEQVIKTELETKGMEVFLLNQDFFEENILDKLIEVYLKKLFIRRCNRYFVNETRKIGKVDYILVIKGSTITLECLEEIKKITSCKHSIMYQWDSVENNKNAILISKYFDRVFTFDPKDSETYGWKYRPLFYSRVDIYNKKEYDVCFIGSLHSKRYQIAKEMEKIANDNNLKYYKYLYVDKWSYIRNRYFKSNIVFQGSKNDLNFKTLSRKEVEKIYSKSKCILDYKSPTQEGVTMRSIESLGFGCKLITNNENIKDEPFFCTNNVWIYGNELDVTTAFINEPYLKLDSQVLSYYSIQNWINDIFGE